MTRWDAARAASQRPTRKYKPVAPVGVQPVIDWGGGRVDNTHRCCGMHVCNCPKLEPFTTIRNPHYIKPGESYVFALNPQLPPLIVFPEELL